MPQYKLNHQKWLQGRESVTVINPAGQRRVCPYAVRYPLTIDEVGRSTGVYLGDGNSWTFSEDDIGANGIYSRWVIEDAYGIRHNVLTSGHSTVASFWEATTINLVIVFNLRDKIEIWKPISTSDEYGRTIKTYEKVVSNLSCRIQPSDRDSTTDLGIPQLDNGYEIFCENLPVRVELDYQVRVISMYSDNKRVDLSGRILELSMVKDTDALDALPTLMAEDNGARWDG
jgi:hypothetical protein